MPLVSHATYQVSTLAYYSNVKKSKMSNIMGQTSNVFFLIDHIHHEIYVVVVVLLLNIHGQQLWSWWDGQLT